MPSRLPEPGRDFSSKLVVEGLLLAGGNSRRMGCDKALLPWPVGESGPEPLLTHLCQVALGVCDRVSVLTPRCDRYAPLLPARCRCILESRSESERPPGPLVAFAEGLAQLNADWILLLACDLPGIEPLLLQSWRSQLESIAPDVNVLLPRGPKGWEPLCGFYRRQSLDSLQAAVTRGEQSFQRWLAHETVQALPLEDDRALQNCNTVEEWNAFLQRFSHKTISTTTSDFNLLRSM